LVTENVEGGSVPAEATAEAPARAVEAGGGALAGIARGRGLLLAAGALLIGAAFWYLQFSTASICCGDFDSYYHFRWSQMLLEAVRTGNFPPSFNALPLTTLNPRDYVDHHFLFHVLQIPFTLFPDFQKGAKIGTWLFASLAVFSCFWLLVRHRVSYPLLWLLLILGSASPFLYRMHMGKAMSVSIVLLVVGIHLLFERKYRWLLPLAFVFALTYDMFALLVVAAGFWTAVVLWTERRLEWRPLVFVAVGSVLGFVINPYFPHNFQLLYEHLVIKVTAKDFSTSVGSEWYPYSTWEFLGNCGTATVAMIAGYLAFRDSAKKEQQRAFFLLLFATFLWVFNARWRRFSEYFPPFAVLFAAFAIQPLVARGRARLFGEAGEAGEVEARGESGRVWEYVLVGTAFVLFAAPMVWYARITRDDIRGMFHPDYYRGGMKWLSDNTSKGELIFNSDWDDFPKLFYYNPDLAFVSGLDPTYLLDKDKRLADLYVKVSAGTDMSDEEVGRMGEMIRDNFCVGEGDRRRCARYAFTDHEHKDFYNNALDSGWFDVAYEDDDCVIFRLREQKGDPIPDNQPPENGPPDEGGDDEPDAEEAPAN
jgi:hypothetical protein